MSSTTVFHRSQHLAETDLVPIPEDGSPSAVWGAACSFCDGTDRNPVWNLQQGPDVDLMECNQCSAISASRFPSDVTLTKYYQGYYSPDVSPTDESKITFDHPERLAKHILKNLPKNSCEVFNILDFGGGDGTIAYLIAKDLVEYGVREVIVKIIDYSDHIVASGNSKIHIEKAESIASLGVEKFSLVIASAVIEHYPAPQQLVSDLLACVKEGGAFYARTPSMIAIMKLAKKIGVHIDFTYPGHMHDLGQKFWEKYFNSMPGFSLVVSRPSIVETVFSTNFFRTLVAYVMKAPWHILGSRYQLVGGWEVLVTKNRSNV